MKKQLGWLMILALVFQPALLVAEETKPAAKPAAAPASEKVQATAVQDEAVESTTATEDEENLDEWNFDDEEDLKEGEGDTAEEAAETEEQEEAEQAVKPATVTGTAAPVKTQQ